MPSLDFRTRSDADVVPVDPVAFFEQLSAAPPAIPGALELNPRPLAIEVDGLAWTMEVDGERLKVTPGSETATAVVILDGEGLTDLVHDVLTPMGFFTGGTLRMPRGRLEDFLDWGVILRSVLDARPIHTKGSVTFSNDLGRTFTPADSDEEMAAFLADAGFLHIAGVFTPDEMAQVSADMDTATPLYAPDDGRSWWARTQSGDNRLVRLQYFQEHSPTTAALLADDRFLRIGRLTDDGYALGESHLGANTIEALVKPLGVVEGISDLPWHKDCSLGAHSFRCCSITVGISVTGADADTGQLRVVAGSHRALIQPAFVRRDLDLPQIDLPTETGDVTVHLSCTLHMSQAPVTAERRVLYTGFRLPEFDRGGHRYGKLNRIREGAYKTVSQVPAG